MTLYMGSGWGPEETRQAIMLMESIAKGSGWVREEMEITAKLLTISLVVQLLLLSVTLVMALLLLSGMLRIHRAMDKAATITHSTSTALDTALHRAGPLAVAASAFLDTAFSNPKTQ